MTETLCDSGAVKIRVGPNASTTITNNPTYMTQFINQAEGDIIAETNCNWIDVYSGMNADFKKVVEGAVAAKAAIRVISYHPDAIGRQTAGFMTNVLWAEYNAAVKVLKDEKMISALGGSVIS